MRIAALPLLLLLAACVGGGRVPVYLNPGTEARLALREEAVCREEARRAVPERRRIGVTPSIGVGVGGGTRVRTGVIFTSGAGGEVYDYDANDGLRGQAVGTCMGGKGYRLIALPACTGAARALASHPFDVSGLCVSRGAIAVPVRAGG